MDSSNLHRTAMELAELGDLRRAAGDTEAAESYYLRALEMETSAARLTPPEIQPTHSILFKSAAFLAIRCGDFDEALRLVDQALVSSPPDEFADELKSLRQRLLNMSRPISPDREIVPKNHPSAK